MSAEGGEKVMVLYNYSYSDDQGPVEIEEGDVYRLVERTNSEWWHVCPLDAKNSPSTEDDGFFVPAQYVRLIEKTRDFEAETESAISSLDDVLEGEDGAEGRTKYANTSVGQRALQGRGQPPQEGSVQSSGSSPSINGMGKNIDTEGDYVNLDQYRAVANIPKPPGQHFFPTSATEDNESEYANLPYQQLPQGMEQGPRLQDGHFVRVLVEGLPWDIYEDQSRRRFFYNRETEELTWKPPRKDKPSSPVAAGPASAAPVQPPSFPGPVPTLVTGSTEDFNQEEYTKTQAEGDVFYVNNSTNEKWQQLKDEGGREYYHRLGSNDTLWDLPTTPRSAKSEEGDSSPRNGEPAANDGKLALVSTLNRQSKSKSMYGKIEPSLGFADPKACTLPPNFSPGSKDQLCGYLNKTKIAEMGKKKIKKSWTQAYLVLQASNLVFYKDHKAAAQKPGSPHGKPEGVISLQGAKVDFNPTKDITSRRNTIVLAVNSGSQFLLHSDDEKTIHEWLVRLKMAANDMDSSPREPDGSGGKMGLGRTLSESSSGQGGEGSMERRNLLGIRAKLLNFLIRRPTQEDLVKQGIIKDAVFGASLQDLCERDRSIVPNFILECITAVENKGLEHDGLYRISGNLSEIQRLRYVIDKADEDHDLSEDQWDIHTLTGALKLFFRELKEPLFPFKCIEKFFEASRKETRKDKLKAFKDALSSLPKCNYETMRVVFQHLKNVVQFSAENRMQTQNVAIVFGPTLMWVGEGDFNKMAVMTVYQSKVVEFLLLEYENLFR
ncbi:rho GTPase-activating protein 12-like isoform X3 [Littorina saxatilis]|uniref:rho GTPase-activating protein 12-like isoform X3 n=1 Tax=Littorina saxatilis TaxID=31220 RepID=UPI0038B6B004